jgi:hypothetical protein
MNTVATPASSPPQGVLLGSGEGRREGFEGPADRAADAVTLLQLVDESGPPGPGPSDEAVRAGDWDRGGRSIHRATVT